MPKTSISISDHFDGFISSQIATGRYDTASEVIRPELRLPEVREMEFKTHRAALIAGETSGNSELRIDGIVTAAKQNRRAKPEAV